MFAFSSKSAVQNIPAKLLNQWLILSSRFLFVANPNLANKMSWESEKRKYISEYDSRDNQQWTKWQDIKTWKQYAQEKNLGKPGTALPGNEIDNSKNEILADKISFFVGDITKLKVNAIVNAANKYLKAGGGVDGAIHRTAGSNLQMECNSLGSCETGDAKIMGGYKLPAKYVIATVGPQGEKPALLKSCYQKSLEVAMANNASTIAFPCISTGIYGYPNEAASHVASYTVRKFLEQHHDKFERVIFCLFMEVDVDLYERILQVYFPLKS
ncbi:macro domain-containing protein mll7730-like [Anthonomus grandis grandis]|uniref:macro domain-containing protein mll7730-like n=1 Tax=Anthonomus grandis grandis TaxID=2921223 RepID=UPI0021662532|nr:macro domain-containing protein mll7730-like [Anthonomus grandis grandis]